MKGMMIDASVTASWLLADELSPYAQRVLDKMTAYDAEYLRTAKELKLSLATLDGNLIAAAKREKVSIFSGT